MCKTKGYQVKECEANARGVSLTEDTHTAAEQRRTKKNKATQAAQQSTFSRHTHQNQPHTTASIIIVPSCLSISRLDIHPFASKYSPLCTHTHTHIQDPSIPLQPSSMFRSASFFFCLTLAFLFSTTTAFLQVPATPRTRTHHQLMAAKSETVRACVYVCVLCVYVYMAWSSPSSSPHRRRVEEACLPLHLQARPFFQIYLHTYTHTHAHNYT